MSKVILISGEICSGKDTTVQRNYSSDQYKHIDLGSLVRKRFQTQQRIFDNNLEPYFIEQISDAIKQDQGKSTFVITGLRQPTLCKKIAALFDEVQYIYLVAPRHILKQRFEDRKDVKDVSITFEDAIAGDQSLGMKELQLYLLTEVQCDFIKTY